jgi:serine/threonine protein phosphatase PrpC
MKYDIAKANRLGNRKSNQDRMGVVETEHAILLVVADGLGGYQGGEQAAETVVNCAIRHFNSAETPIKNPGALINEMIMRAHREVLALSDNGDSRVQGKSTCVICLIVDGFAYWGHLGDSRLYVIRNNSIYKQTVDHSRVEELFKLGKITEKEKETHPHKNLITRCVGSDNKRPQPTISSGLPLQTDDVILLSSDGFWSPLSEKEIVDGVKKNNFTDAIENLISDAEEASYPKADNISVVGLRWLSTMEKKKPAPKKQDPIKQTGKDIEEVNRELDDIVKKLKQIVGK